MGQYQLRAPMLGAVWGCALVALMGVSPCAAQGELQNPPNPSLPSPAAEADDVLDMDLDQLSQADVLVPSMDTVVSSVSRQESTVGRSPAAVFVITPEMIRRSAANNIPDVLRMVPGLEVAQIDANKWAITCRGFNGLYASKLLVQIDGRAVYSQFFSGVIWSNQDVVLEDVERIEVIRGPGATVWGANAVNGVINIITKRAQDTQGLLVIAGTGTEDREFGTVRYGGQVGDDLYWRAYGKQFEIDDGYFLGEDFDDWRQARGGFRMDWTPSCDDICTVQGDIFDGDAGELATIAFPTPPFARASIFDNHEFGENCIFRWTHDVDEDSDWAFQAYYDRYGRDTPFVDLEQETFDLDFQYHFLVGESHNVICGAGYRQIDDHFIGDFALSLDPTSGNTNLFSYFVQDEITLSEDEWYLIVGSKFEHNDFTGFEFQPSVRLLWLPSDRQSVWAAVSRAVQTPDRTDQDVTFYQFAGPGPTFVRFTGNDSLDSEDLLAYELGYRAQPTDDFSWDLALFYNDYADLTDVQPLGAPFFDPSIPAFIIPLTLGNGLAADTYGAELASTYRVRDDWELVGTYALLYMDVHAPANDFAEGSSPHNHAYLRSSWDLPRDWEFDLIGRYVDNLPALGVSSYLTMDVRLAWQPFENLEWAVVGRNLLDDRHAEFVDVFSGITGTEVQSQVYTTLTWTY